MLLRPVAVPPASRGWLPLLAGVAVAAGIRAQTGLDVSLKWPNDVVLIGEGRGAWASWPASSPSRPAMRS